MSSRNRRQARTTALQALYELDSTNHSVADVMSARLEEQPIPDDLRQFAYKLVNGVLANKPRMDQIIQEHAPEWPLIQMAVVDRNILRLAIYEFAVLEETPLKVVVNEAVELAKEFGSDNASRFINGVLGAVAAREKELRAALKEGQQP
ncbi:MAG: transcription antitermination factor NusB [Anaerolineae bacterium]|nr:transcription antitermination factor NusB [Anaerolineae bacterium]